jgi:hypothetical protein
MQIAVDSGRLPEVRQHLRGNQTPRDTDGDCLLPPLRPFLGSLRRYRCCDVRPVRTQQHLSMACVLVKNLYSSRGYATGSVRQRLDDPDRLTLAAWVYGELVATLTLGRDCPSGLLADELYASEVASLRRPNRVVCEVSRLAVDPDFTSRELLTTLFRAAHLHGKNAFAASDVVIEVNPRHAGYYQRYLGFRQLGSLRQCPRVDAPAVLLHQTVDAMAFLSHAP